MVDLFGDLVIRFAKDIIVFIVFDDKPFLLSMMCTFQDSGYFICIQLPPSKYTYILLNEI